MAPPEPPLATRGCVALPWKTLSSTVRRAWMWPMAPPLPPRFPVKTELRTLTVPGDRVDRSAAHVVAGGRRDVVDEAHPLHVQGREVVLVHEADGPPEVGRAALRRVRFRRVIVNEANW